MRERVIIRVTSFTDRRSPELQCRYENILEKRWRARVHLATRRAAIKRWQISLVSRLGHMGASENTRPGRQGGGSTPVGNGSTPSGIGPYILLHVRDLPDRGPTSVGLPEG